jgi:serine phosphatase RsbU (regulator of sigma subunit)/anti-sigma regulatory factor (Ser/Thr protein kinase)
MPVTSRESSRSFPPDERSVDRARWFVRGELETWGAPELVDSAVLATSELVTNAVLHAGTTVEVRLVLGADRMRLEVQDQHPGRALPLGTSAPSDDAEHGRGLLITAALSSSWGVEYTATMKRLWLEIDREPEHARPADEAPVPALATVRRDGVERTPAASVAALPSGDVDITGLRGDALTRLDLDDYLSLAVERCRAVVGADATYLLLARDFDADLEVVAVSGMDARLQGRRLDRNALGTLNRSNPRLPVVENDVTDGAVPLLAGTGLRSLLVVPVLIEGQVVGALGAATEGRGGLDRAQAATLHRFAGSLALATDRARLRAAEQERRRWSGLVDEAGALLADSLDEKMTIALTAQVVVPHLASWCAIHLRDTRGRLVLRHVWHEDEASLDALRATLEATGSDGFDGPVQTLPLIARGRDIGTLTLGRPGAPPLRGEVYRIADSLARRAAMAIDNARAHGELMAAGEALQRSLLPPSIPTPPGLEVGVVYEPADESTTAGGDFYDLFALGDGRWCWVVGDVCGTGAEAAAVTGLARHTIRALAMIGVPVPVTLERLNAAIIDEGERARFLTLACGVIGPVRGGRARLGLVVAGHPPPFLVRDGEVRQVGRPQMLLGVQEQVTYAEEYLDLERGDLLVAVTDGVLEGRNGDRLLGEQDFEAELAKTADLPAQLVAERIRELVLDFVDAPHRDDMAVVALRLPPAVTPAAPA